MSTSNDFIPIMRAVEAMRRKWVDDHKTGTNDLKSVHGIHKQMRVARQFVENERRDYEGKIRSLGNRLNSSYIQRERRSIDDKFTEMKEEVIRGVKQDIRNFVMHKTEQLDRMLATPPTASQLSLLQALQMRSKNLSRAELIRLIPVFYQNYEAMRILDDIAESAGYPIHALQLSGIDCTDITALYDKLDEVGEYLMIAADEIGRPGKPEPTFRAFYYINPEDPNEYDADVKLYQFKQIFDRIPQLQDFTVAELSNAEAAMIDSYFKPIADVDDSTTVGQLRILRHCLEVYRDHKEDVALIMKSKYARYMAEAMEHQKKNEEQFAAAAAAVAATPEGAAAASES